MATRSTLHDAFLDELRDLYNAETQLVRALPKMAKSATAAPLADAFEAHHKETVGHVARLERVFESLGERASGKKCEGITGILEESKEVMAGDFEEAAMDALLIAGAQRAEHYEMAAYGTVVAWAQAMGHKEAVRLLKETLDEEKAADEKLTALAEGGVNEQAAAAAHEDEDTEARPAAGKRRKQTASSR